MLKNIFIQNYALIDQLELQFEGGLNIITGETGAGKSILLGALSLLLGNRADTTALFDAAKKCIVEGKFDSDKSLKDFFKNNELDFEEHVVIRREISSEGKSRSFINDTPVTLSQLKELGLLLVDIHSQHETLLLNKSGFQLSIVDAFAQHDKIRVEYKNHFQQFQSLNNELAILIEEEKKSKADLDYFQFLFDELEEANLAAGEQENLEEELQLFTHSEEIKVALTFSLATLTSNENSILIQLTQLANSVNGITKFNSKLEEIADRIKSASIELNDISSEIESISDEINFDPKRVEIINERLNTIYRLQQKHRVKTVDELIKLKYEFEGKLQNINSLEEKIKELEIRIDSLNKNLTALAQQLSSNRNKAIPVIEKEIKKLLSEVSLPNAVLKIENNISSTADLTTNGIDQIRFLFSANKGVAYSDISKVASGGELSRLMLCIKSSIAKLVELPTIIFDEIDTGISGETAVNVGRVLKDMSKRHQLITITHLPQIAGRGESHFFVYKEISGKKTFTKVRKLNADERIVEIAKMLSGEKPSAVAIENAKELLKQ
jgi:DNA repair protein RecN (Recombination protein N)